MICDGLRCSYNLRIAGKWSISSQRVSGPVEVEPLSRCKSVCWTASWVVWRRDGGRGGRMPSSGALDGGSPMSHVDFKKWQCCMSLSLIFSNVTCQNQEKALSHVTIIFSPCRMSLSPMSHVKFKKCPCRPVDFRGQGP